VAFRVQTKVLRDGLSLVRDGVDLTL
jgi:hypothetical protein